MCPTLSEKLRGCQHHELDETHVYTGLELGEELYSWGGCKLLHKFQLPPLRDQHGAAASPHAQWP